MEDDRPDDVCVVVPVLNEAPTVGAVVADLKRRFRHVLCVDDGSTDGSGDIAAENGALVLRHAVNLGQGGALQTGFDYVVNYTACDFCITFDADGQHLVTDAERMLEQLRDAGADIALASRFAGSTANMPKLRASVLRLATCFTRATCRLDVTDTHNGLRVLRRSALERIQLRMSGMAYASELLSAIVPSGLSYIEVPTTVVYTQYSKDKGQSNLNAVNILFDLAVHRLVAVR